MTKMFDEWNHPHLTTDEALANLLDQLRDKSPQQSEYVADLSLAVALLAYKVHKLEELLKLKATK